MTEQDKIKSKLESVIDNVFNRFYIKLFQKLEERQTIKTGDLESLIKSYVKDEIKATFNAQVYVSFFRKMTFIALDKEGSFEVSCPAYYMSPKNYAGIFADAWKAYRTKRIQLKNSIYHRLKSKQIVNTMNDVKAQVEQAQSVPGPGGIIAGRDPYKHVFDIETTSEGMVLGYIGDRKPIAGTHDIVIIDHSSRIEREDWATEPALRDNFLDSIRNVKF